MPQYFPHHWVFRRELMYHLLAATFDHSCLLRSLLTKFWIILHLVSMRHLLGKHSIKLHTYLWKPCTMNQTQRWKKYNRNFIFPLDNYLPFITALFIFPKTYFPVSPLWARCQTAAFSSKSDYFCSFVLDEVFLCPHCIHCTDGRTLVRRLDLSDASTSGISSVQMDLRRST